MEILKSEKCEITLHKIVKNLPDKMEEINAATTMGYEFAINDMVLVGERENLRYIIDGNEIRIINFHTNVLIYMGKLKLDTVLFGKGGKSSFWELLLGSLGGLAFVGAIGGLIAWLQ